MNLSIAPALTKYANSYPADVMLVDSLIHGTYEKYNVTKEKAGELTNMMMNAVLRGTRRREHKSSLFGDLETIRCYHPTVKNLVDFDIPYVTMTILLQFKEVLESTITNWSPENPRKYLMSTDKYYPLQGFRPVTTPGWWNGIIGAIARVHSTVLEKGIDVQSHGIDTVELMYNDENGDVKTISGLVFYIKEHQVFVPTHIPKI